MAVCTALGVASREPDLTNAMHVPTFCTLNEMRIMRTKQPTERRVIFAPACLLLFTLACEREAGIIVNIAAWPDAVERLRVRTTLEQTPGMEIFLNKDQTRFVIRLPRSSAGTVHLDAAGLDITDCTRAVGNLTEPVPNTLDMFVERTLRLSELNAPLCVLAGHDPDHDFKVGPQPYSVAVGDFNGDMKLDLTTANFAVSNLKYYVSVLLGDGAGRFGPAANFEVGTSPRSVAVGDFNGDKKLDLAVANYGSTTVSVLLNNGLGGFDNAPSSPVSVGNSPISVAVNDFNGDTKPDLVVANAGSSNVSVLLGDGTGRFSAASNFTVGAIPRSVAIGDFNGDLKLDLAVTNAGDKVSVLLGNGLGNFSLLGPAITIGTNVYSLAIGDFNGDMKPDLAVPHYGGSDVSILLGDGTGGFGPPTNFPAGFAPFSVAIGDFNGDMKSDLAFANSGSSNASLILGNGLGRFGPVTNFPVTSISYSLAVGDFNRDMKLDLAVANVGYSNVSILLNQF